jgi:hypothetical protein
MAFIGFTTDMLAGVAAVFAPATNNGLRHFDVEWQRTVYLTAEVLWLSRVPIFAS